MKKVFHFDSQTDAYRADACVVSCFDARFELVTRKFLKKRGIWWADPLKIAGGAKAFASPAEESERSFAAQIALATPHIQQAWGSICSWRPCSRSTLRPSVSRIWTIQELIPS